MRILVCGGRDYARVDKYYGCPHDDQNYKDALKEYEHVQLVLSALARKHSKHYDEHDNWLPFDIVIIEGDAKGADRAASDWAVCNYSKHEVYPADWQRHGKAAGPIRNRQMLNEGKPDLVVAFPGGAGTAHMVSIAKVAGVEVIVYE